MKTYNGIEVDRTSKEWKDLKDYFPETKWGELALRTEIGFAKMFKDEGIELNEEIWLLSVREIAKVNGWNVASFCVRIFGRWTKGLESAFGKVYFKGTGDCANCGGNVEHEDEGLVRCTNCGELQDADTSPEKYYDPRMD